MINIGIGIGWAKALYSVANNVIANFKARVLSYPNSIFEAGPCLDATLEELNAIGLLDNASLIVTPNAYNEGVLYDVIPNTPLGDMDVVRATTATRVNSAGLIEEVPRNLFSYSEEFNNAYWATDAVITTNTIISPNGTLTADTLTGTGVLGINDIYTGFSGASSTTATIFVKKNTAQFVYLSLNYQSTGTDYATGVYDLDNLTTAVYQLGGVTSPIATITNFGNGWRRISLSVTTGNNFLYCMYGISDSLTPTLTARGRIVLNTSQSFYIWGAQVELGATATEYFPTTTRLNIPRIDYTNGSCPSLLVEPQRTNLALRSEEFDNAYWTKSNSTISANSIISPSGIQNADKLIENNGTGAKWVFFTPTVITGSAYTYSVYAKKAERNFVYINAFSGTAKITWFNLNTGTVGTSQSGIASIQDVGNGWYKCSLTITIVAGTQFYLVGVSNADSVADYTGNGTSGIHIWGAQLELGSYSTSYIPTTTATVTRNAELISKTGISSLIGQTEGTIFLDINKISRIDNATRLNLSDGTDNNWIFVGLEENNIPRFYVRTASSTVVDLVGSSLSNGRHKLAAAYKNNDFVFYVDGIQIGVDSLGNVGSMSQFHFGGNYINQIAETDSRTNSIALFKTRLTNSELQSLTTL